MIYKFTLIVKGDPAFAVENAKRRGVVIVAEPIFTGETTTIVGESNLGPVSEWFLEDLYGPAPYAKGSLLSYRFR